MRKTLKDFREIYKPLTISLIFGEHLVNIHTECYGSNKLVEVFQNEKFFFKAYVENLLILEY